MDYDKILSRYATYKQSTFRDLRSLSKTFGQGGAAARQHDRVSQANTEGSQCVLEDGDTVYNFVEKKSVGGLADMLPAGASDREVVDEVMLGGVTLAELINWASDAQWIRVIRGLGRRRAQQIYGAIRNEAAIQTDCYHVRLVDSRSGALVQGLVTNRRASEHIEDLLAEMTDNLIVWYGYEKDEVMQFVNVYLCR